MGDRNPYVSRVSPVVVNVDDTVIFKIEGIGLDILADMCPNKEMKIQLALSPDLIQPYQLSPPLILNDNNTVAASSVAWTSSLYTLYPTALACDYGNVIYDLRDLLERK